MPDMRGTNNARHYPVDWRSFEISEVSYLVTNGFVGTATPHYVDDAAGVLYVQGFNVRENRIILANTVRVSREFHERQCKSQLREGDMLTVQSGHIGVTAVVPPRFPEANCHALIITRFDRAIIEPQFVAYFLNSELGKRLLLELVVGSSIKHINTKDLRRLRIPVPCLAEQQKITEILSTWEAAIARVEQLISALQLRKEGLMQRLLTGKLRFPHYSDSEWRVNRFDSFLELQRGFDLPVQKRQDGDVPILASNGQIGWHAESRVGGPGVVTGRSGTIGNVHYVDADFWPLNTTLYVRDFHGNYPKFVYYFLQQFDLSRFATGSGVPTLNRNDVHPIMISLPDTSEQTIIADMLTACDDELSLHVKELSALHQQKKGLQQRLLTGQQRVHIEGNRAI